MIEDIAGNILPISAITNIKSFKSDLEFGLKNEDHILDLIKKNFKDYKNIKNTKELYNEFCLWDFESEEGVKFELKTRRFIKNKYSTTLLPVSKITGSKDQYFIFNFIDYIGYIKFDFDVFKKFNTQMIKVNRVDRYDKPKEHFLIPISCLIDLKPPPENNCLIMDPYIFTDS